MSTTDVVKLWECVVRRKYVAALDTDASEVPADLEAAREVKARHVKAMAARLGATEVYVAKMCFTSTIAEDIVADVAKEQLTLDGIRSGVLPILDYSKFTGPFHVHHGPILRGFAYGYVPLSRPDDVFQDSGVTPAEPYLSIHEAVEGAMSGRWNVFILCEKSRVEDIEHFAKLAKCILANSLACLLRAERAKVRFLQEELESLRRAFNLGKGDAVAVLRDKLVRARAMEMDLEMKESEAKRRKVE
jgi:hypothetical protein